MEASRVRAEEPLKALLRANGTPLKTKTARAFLNTIENHAPWFLDEGEITSPLWDRLGDDLRQADKREPLPPGTIPIWGRVKNCLKGQKPSCREAIQEGEEILEEVREERAFAKASEGGSEQGLPSDEDEDGELSGDELENRFNSRVKLTTETFYSEQSNAIMKKQGYAGTRGLGKDLQGKEQPILLAGRPPKGPEGPGLGFSSGPLRENSL